jgi:predicted membrane-bound mannosyltransferase
MKTHLFKKELTPFVLQKIKRFLFMFYYSVEKVTLFIPSRRLETVSWAQICIYIAIYIQANIFISKIYIKANI